MSEREFSYTQEVDKEEIMFFMEDWNYYTGQELTTVNIFSSLLIKKKKSLSWPLNKKLNSGILQAL